MTKKLRICYLWAELTGYIESVAKHLADQGHSVAIVFWDKKTPESTQHAHAPDGAISLLKRSTLNTKELYSELCRIKPNILAISGWMDPGYTKAAIHFKKNHPNTRLVLALDSPWLGTIRQRFGAAYHRLRYNKHFDFAWICGPQQHCFAERLGYKRDEIVPFLYTADTNTFNTVANFTKRFLYVGRFVAIKAPHTLSQAYSRLPEKVQHEWPLFFIGDGPLKHQLNPTGNPNIHLLPYMQPADLRDELLNGGVACLPSVKDNWGVAVHEFALLGLPLVLSSGVGSAPAFLLSGFNGYLFKAQDVSDLQQTLLNFSTLDNADIARFRQNSRVLGKTISIELSAMSLLSVASRRSKQGIASE